MARSLLRRYDGCTEQIVKHLLSVPPGPGPHPVLCFLHGYDEAAPAPLEQALTRHGPLRPGNPPLVAERFIVLAPQLPFAGDIWHRYAHDLHRLVESTLEAHGGDAERVYLTGFSFGANGVFDLAHFERRAWAALWVVDPTRLPRRPVRQPVWFSAGEVSRHLKDSFAGVAVKEKHIYEDRGDDHVGTAKRAYADERIYSWLLRFSMKAGCQTAR